MATIISSREFNQDTSGAKKAANEAPVFITDRGRPTHVLLSIHAYEQLTGNAANIVELLRMPEDIDFEPQRVPLTPRPVDLS